MHLEGTYNDGQTAVTHQVLVYVTGAALHIHGAGNQRLAEWTLAGLRLVEEVYPGRPVRLCHKEFRDASLTLTDPEQAAHLLELRLAGQFGRMRFRPAALKRQAPFWLIALVLVVAGMFWLVPRAAQMAVPLVPVAWESALGEQVVENLKGDAGFCQDPAGLKTLKKLTQRLTAGIEMPYPVQVHVSSMEVINAFAAPGGHVVMLDGLLQYAESPEEVAGVLAHELAHSARRHPMGGVLRALGFNLLLTAIFGGYGGESTWATKASEVLLTLSYTREAEAEADRIGVELLNKAGISSQGLIDFFSRIQAEHGGPKADNKFLKLLTSHPANTDRVRMITSMARGQDAAMTAAEWEQLRHVCATTKDAESNGSPD